ncbi:hypothetical protein [Fluviicola sp.]|jgi:hypothetical protein|uniref:hypothetical protein n=1 Tax=Fluviicola sp. TaxID=1917219 RepID=UPI00282EA669|nr:hypothetical protein [Fluviicola sp.]MDR0802493.1 hypothetical protein [Fluviicola sp.]
MKGFIFTILFPLIASSQNEWQKVNAQVFLDLIRQYEQSIPTGENYSLETGYKIYNDYNDLQPVQSFEGKLICRAGKELNIFQMGHRMIQDASVNITLDTTGKQLLVQKADPSFFYRKTIEDYTIFLELIESVYQKTENTNQVYLLQLKNGNPYHAMEFTFSDKNFISQIVIYSNQPYYTEGEADSSGKAKIVLDFKNFRKGKAVDFSHFLTVKNCILIKDDQLIPVGSYMNFEVIDLRN